MSHTKSNDNNNENVNDNNQMMKFDDKRVTFKLPRSFPMNYRFTHSLPINMKYYVNKPILSELGRDNSFEYRPILSRYQISTQSYCESCYGLLNETNTKSNYLHIRTVHNYPCPNTGCQRQFVLKEHLSIHLDLCGESKKLSTEIKGMDEDQFKNLLLFVIKTPNRNYQNIKNINATKQWMEEQMNWFHKNCKKGKNRKKKNEKNKQKLKIKDIEKVHNANDHDEKTINSFDSEDTVSIENEKIEQSEIKISDTTNNGYVHNQVVDIKQHEILQNNDNQKKRVFEDIEDNEDKEQIFEPPIKRRKLQKELAIKTK